jgi:hypothetical protein
MTTSEATDYAQSIDLSGQPVMLNRKAAAALITRLFFPVAAKTLERWPVAVRHVNGRAMIDTREIVAFAAAKIAAAPVFAGGQSPRAQ